MINLLPPSYKKELRDEENLRILFILITSFGVFLLVLSLLLLALRVYLWGELSSQKLLSESFAQELATQSKERQEMQETEADFQVLLRTDARQVSLTETFQHLFSALPSEVSLLSLSFSSPRVTFLKGKTIQEHAQVILQGSSPSRDDLTRFRENLEQDTFFRELFFPLSNFTNLQKFSLSIKITSF
ncbi:MAG: PilN domain-containing protein [bacterium]|nr:PilN domain-containing protein [bacterium]